MGTLYPTFNQSATFKPQHYIHTLPSSTISFHVTTAPPQPNDKSVGSTGNAAKLTLRSARKHWHPEDNRVVTSYSHRSFKWLEVQGLEYGQAPFTEHTTVIYISLKSFYWPFG